MSTRTTARRQEHAVATSIPVKPVAAVVPTDLRATPAANHEVAKGDERSNIDPLVMISVAFVGLFALLAILSAS